MPVEEVGIAGVGYLPFISPPLSEGARLTRFEGRGKKDEDGEDCSNGGSSEGAGRFVPAPDGAVGALGRPEGKTMPSKDASSMRTREDFCRSRIGSGQWSEIITEVLVPR